MISMFMVISKAILIFLFQILIKREARDDNYGSCMGNSGCLVPNPGSTEVILIKSKFFLVFLNPVMPGVHKMVKRATNLAASAARFLTCV